MSFFIRNHGASTYFAAGAGRRGKGDPEWNFLIDRACPRFFVFVVKEIARVMNHERDGLCDIQRGSTADSDDSIGLVRFEGLDTRADLAFHRIAPDLRKRGGLGSFGADLAEKTSIHIKTGDATVGHDQGASDLICFQMIGHQKARTGAEVNQSGKTKTISAHLFLLYDFKIAAEFPAGD